MNNKQPIWKAKPRFHGVTRDAVYSDPEVNTYVGNPFIEALPPILTEQAAIALMRYRPIYHESYCQLPAHQRIHYIMDILRYVQPLRRYRALEQLVSCFIRVGYTSRNPIEPDYISNFNNILDDFMKALISEQPYYLPNEPSSTVISGALFGTSGVGKTVAIERILKLYPQVIRHRKYKDNIITVDQLVWLKLECPHNGSTRALCLQFFEEIDEILGTSYFKLYVKPGNNVDVLVGKMARVALIHGLGILVIDELQHLSVARSGGPEEMLNFFVCLQNKLGVPVLLIGTPHAMKIITGFREIRRISGYSMEPWDRMAQDEEWQYFIEGLWTYQYTKNHTVLTREISDVLYEYSQGIADFVVKLFIMAQIRAIESNHEIITPDIIRSVARDGFKLAMPLLNALKHNDSTTVEKYQDVFIDIQPFFLSALNKIDEKAYKEQCNDNLKNNIIYETASWLMDGGFSYDIAFRAAQNAVDQLGHDSPLPILRKLATSHLFQSQASNKDSESLKEVANK